MQDEISRLQDRVNMLATAVMLIAIGVLCLSAAANPARRRLPLRERVLVLHVNANPIKRGEVAASPNEEIETA